MAPEPSPHYRCRSIIAVFLLGLCFLSRIHAQSDPLEWSKKRILGNEIGFTYKAEDEQKLAHVLDSFGFSTSYKYKQIPHCTIIRSNRTKPSASWN